MQPLVVHVFPYNRDFEYNIANVLSVKVAENVFEFHRDVIKSEKINPALSLPVNNLRVRQTVNKHRRNRLVFYSTLISFSYIC